MSRDINKATAYMQWFWHQLYTAVKLELGLIIFLLDVDRDWKVQRAYYAQGRDPLHIVNALRKEAGLPTITAKQNEKKITWTMKSKHITNLDNQALYDNYSRAIDIGLKDKDGRYVGDSQADLNKDNKKDYQQIGEIGERIGGMRIRWGGRFGDPAHFEEVT
jgi:hypothetical protein